MKCIKFGEELAEEALYCLKCGSKQGEQKENIIVKSENISDEIKVCSKCGATLDDEAEFCHNCGYNVKTGRKVSNKKKIWIPILIAISILVIGGGTAFIIYRKNAAAEAARQAELARQAEIIEYCLKCESLLNQINESSSNFEVLNTMFSTSVDLETSWLMSTDDYINYSVSLCTSEISEERTRKVNIDGIYKEIQELGCDEPEIQELKDCVNSTYSSYVSLYNVLVLQQFAASSYKSTYSALSSGLSEAKKGYNATLDSLDEQFGIYNIEEE